MKKIIFIGQTGCGKTTLCQYLHDMEIKYKKTQQIDFFKDSIDTPGEFLENRFLYNALISTSVEAEYIGFIQNAENQFSYFPPFFASTFNKFAIGIISKIDKVSNEKQIMQAERFLTLAGVKKIFKISTVTGEGLEEFSEWLNDENKIEKKT